MRETSQHLAENYKPEAKITFSIEDLERQAKVFKPILTLHWLFSDKPVISGFVKPAYDGLEKEYHQRPLKLFPPETVGWYSQAIGNRGTVSSYEEIVPLVGKDFFDGVMGQMEDLQRFENITKEQIIKQDKFLLRGYKFFKALPNYLRTNKDQEVPISEREAALKAEGEMISNYGGNWREDETNELKREFERKTQINETMASKQVFVSKEERFKEVKEELQNEAANLLAYGYKAAALAAFEIGHGYYARDNSGSLVKLTKEEFVNLDIKVVAGFYDGMRDRVVFEDVEGNGVEVFYSTDSVNKKFQPKEITFRSDGFLFGNPVVFGLYEARNQGPMNGSEDLLTGEKIAFMSSLISGLTNFYQQSFEMKSYSNLQEWLGFFDPNNEIRSPNEIRFLLDTPENFLSQFESYTVFPLVLHWLFIKNGIDYYLNREIAARGFNCPSVPDIERKEAQSYLGISPKKETVVKEPRTSLLKGIKAQIFSGKDSKTKLRTLRDESAYWAGENLPSEVTNIGQERIKPKFDNLAFMAKGDFRLLKETKRWVYRENDKNDKYVGVYKLQTSEKDNLNKVIVSSIVLLEKANKAFHIPLPNSGEIQGVKLFYYENYQKEKKVDLTPNQFVLERSVGGHYRVRILDEKVNSSVNAMFYEAETIVGDPKTEINPKGLLIPNEGVSHLIKQLKRNNLEMIAEALSKIREKKEQIDVVDLVGVLQTLSYYSFDGKSVSRSGQTLEQFATFFDSDKQKYGVQCDAASLMLSACLKVAFRNDPKINVSSELCFVIDNEHLVKSKKRFESDLYALESDYHAQVKVEKNGKIFRFDSTPPREGHSFGNIIKALLKTGESKPEQIVVETADGEKREIVAANEESVDEERMVSFDESYSNELKSRNVAGMQSEFKELIYKFAKYGTVNGLRKADRTEPMVIVTQSLKLLEQLNDLTRDQIKERLTFASKSVDILNWLNSNKSGLPVFEDGTLASNDFIQATEAIRKRSPYYRNASFVRQLGYFIDEIML